MAKKLVDVKYIVDEKGRIYQFSYYRLKYGSLYGARIADQSGAAETVMGITEKRWRINALIERLVRGRVSPCALKDVTEDFLCGL